MQFVLGQIDVKPEVERLDVVLDETLRRLSLLSQTPYYNLIISDFGFVEDKAKDILWGKERDRKPTREDAKGRILTIRDLRAQFEEWRNLTEKKPSRNKNVFAAARRVIIRNFASRLAIHIKHRSRVA